MYAQVIVKTKIPSIGKSYTYEIPQELSRNALPGAMVDVPFGKKTLEGMIFTLTNMKPDFETKPIQRVLPNPPVLNESSLDIAMWMSTHYSANFFDCIAGMLPKQGSENNGKKHIDTKELENDLNLTLKQQKVFTQICNIIYVKGKSTKKILLHGVTGSGKTEIYLQISRILINEGKQVLFMVPEISLTPQLIHRFSARFGEENIAIVHSHISANERVSSWNHIKEGKAKIVIGSRSAILSPFKNLGAILIDECHEQSFKQDKAPRYNAITLAEYVSSRDNILLLLGSATPLVEQYYKTTTGEYHLSKLPDRISSVSQEYIVVDLKEERKNNNYSLLSKDLLNRLKEVISKNEQSLLYLNRRGIRSGLLCTACGSYELCPRCAMPLTIHKKKGEDILVCHYCFLTKPMVKECSVCNSKFIKAVGVGTQTILEQVKELIPQSRPIIMDKDTTTKKGSHEKIFNAFEKKEADVLIGTQMITKGWDISNVSLTGYLLLDSDLIFPSFRTSERVYQLITQLTGRSGRGDKPGVSLIQTYNPQNPILISALHGSYEDFYTSEIAIRKRLMYPPFVDIIQIVSKDKNERLALKKLNTYFEPLNKAITPITGRYDITLLGPSRCFVPKVNNDYFFQVTIKIQKGLLEEDTESNRQKVIDIINQTKRPNGILINIEPFDLQ